MSGGIPLDSRGAARVHNQALERAAALLCETAQDYEQMAAQNDEERRPIYKPAAITRAATLREKAQLLRGQAAHIREMKLQER